MDDGRSSAGTSFEALRDYQPGDPLRRIHWRSSARAGRPLLRVDLDPEGPVSTVLLDVRATVYGAGDAGGAAFEEAVDVAASILAADAARSWEVRLATTAGDGPVAGVMSGGGVLSGRLLDVLTDVCLVDGSGRTCTPAAALAAALHAGDGTGPVTVVTGPFAAAADLGLPSTSTRAWPPVVTVRVGAATDQGPSGEPSTGPSTGPGGEGARTAGVNTDLRVVSATDLAALWPPGGIFASGRPLIRAATS